MSKIVERLRRNNRDGEKLYTNRAIQKNDKREREGKVVEKRGQKVLVIRVLKRSFGAEITGTYIMQCFFYGSTANRARRLK